MTEGQSVVLGRAQEAVCMYECSKPPKRTSLGQTSPLSSRLITASLISALRGP